MPVPVLRGERAAGRRRARRRKLALAARARPLPARAVRDVLPRVAGARPRPHHVPRDGRRAGAVRGDCRARAPIVVAGRSGARARAAARLGRRVRHCRSRVRDGSGTRRRDPRAIDGVRARRRVHVRRRRRRDARRAAAREDRSRRRARRRHVPVDRLQDQVRARSPNGAATADLQPLREPDLIRAARPHHHRERGDVSVVRGPAGGGAPRRAREAVRRPDDVCQPSPGGGVERHCARPLPALPETKNLCTMCRVHRRVPIRSAGCEPSEDTEKTTEDTEGV